MTSSCSDVRAVARYDGGTWEGRLDDYLESIKTLMTHARKSCDDTDLNESESKSPYLVSKSLSFAEMWYTAVAIRVVPMPSTTDPDSLLTPVPRLVPANHRMDLPR